MERCEGRMGRMKKKKRGEGQKKQLSTKVSRRARNKENKSSGKFCAEALALVIGMRLRHDRTDVMPYGCDSTDLRYHEIKKETAM